MIFAHKYILISLFCLVSAIHSKNFFLFPDMETTPVFLIADEYRLSKKLSFENKVELQNIFDKYDLSKEGETHNNKNIFSRDSIWMSFTIKNKDRNYHLVLFLTQKIFCLDEIISYEEDGAVFGDTRLDNKPAITRRFTSKRLYEDLSNFILENSSPLPKLKRENYEHVLPYLIVNNSNILSGRFYHIEDKKKFIPFDAHGKEQLKSILGKYDLLTEGKSIESPLFTPYAASLIVELNQKPYLLILYPNEIGAVTSGYGNIMTIHEIILFDETGKYLLKPIPYKYEDRVFQSERLYEELQEVLNIYSPEENPSIIPENIQLNL